MNLARLTAEIDHLATLSSHPAPAVTRVLFSAEDFVARAWLIDLAAQAGFRTRSDAVGNLFITWTGSDAALPAVATGSHTDAIPNAGKYDGVVGVLGGLEAMRSLRETGHQPTRSIELIMFTAEEPTRFGIGCLGSRLLAGNTTPAQAQALRDPALVTLIESTSAALGFSHQRMISRAYHDSLFMARLCPTTMIFIPCDKGHSHRPDEYSSPEAITKGTTLLAETLRQLSSK